jgi:hypothetical protein
MGRLCPFIKGENNQPSPCIHEDCMFFRRLYTIDPEKKYTKNSINDKITYHLGGLLTCVFLLQWSKDLIQYEKHINEFEDLEGNEVSVDDVFTDFD